MNKMQSQKIQTKKAGGEFLVSVIPGDVFLSFHHSSEECAAVYFRKNDISAPALERVMKQIGEYFADDLSSVELKIIASEKTVGIITHHLKKINFQSVKKIEKNADVDVCFLPGLNKVRVSIEPVAKSTKEKFKVLIVDDSKTIRTILSKIFSSDPMFEVCAMAEKPSDVEALILKHKPDVITLDIHMPEMDGVTLLKTIITPKYQIPTVMISSISMAEGPLVLDALENGAVDYIQKPEMSEIEKVTPFILEKVRAAAMSRNGKKSRRERPKAIRTSIKCDLDSLIVLGSSTGGTEAIRDILTAMPDQIPPMLIVQHIPAVFSQAFAKRMNELCPFEVKEAVNGDEVKTNRVLIAPGGMQMKMIHKAGKTFVEINDDEPVNRFKPSVDYMFLTVAKSLFTHTVAVILTGMGKDGAKGMLELRNLGVRTIAQDEESSVVFGMPKEAIHIGAAEFVEPLNSIAEKICLLTSQKKNRREVS